jgi:flagellar hook-basal body complex protein FliE
MSDPLGLVSQQGGMPIRPGAGLGKGFPGAPGAVDPTGGDFKKELLEQMDAVSKLQQDAEQAKAAGVAGEARIEDVMIATAKADTAFNMLLAVRNKLMEAYEDVKNLRV